MFHEAGPEFYTDTYYRTQCGGHELFESFDGWELEPLAMSNVPEADGARQRALETVFRWYRLKIDDGTPLDIDPLALSITDRGLIRSNYKADVVIFDPATVIDNATFDKPTLISEGVKRVFVNGAEVWRDGSTTGNLPGKALRRR